MDRIIDAARRRALLALPALAFAPLAGAKEAEPERTGGPYVPTPQTVVDQMLRIGQVGGNDFVVDLGSGDGVIVLTAVSRFNARGFGVDIDPALVRRSNDEARRRGIADRASFAVQDVFRADLSRATVVTLYLLPEMMANLRGKLLAEPKPGTRVVSHDYVFGEWQPDEQFTWAVPEKEAVTGIPQATVYLWVVPAQVAGAWQLRVAGGQAATRQVLTLRQEYQHFSGVDSTGARLTVTQLRGSEITFSRPVAGGRETYRGRVAADMMEGTVELPHGRGSSTWSAQRVPA